MTTLFKLTNSQHLFFPDSPSNRFAFMPFSTGPRICVGYRFALMEIKVVLATLIQKFSFSMIPGMSFESIMSVTYKPKPNLELLVRKVIMSE
jgi:cytochrome P450